MDSARILVVGEDAPLAVNLADAVRRLGYAVFGPVSTGEAAIVYLQESLADLVLIDVELAGELSGIQTAEIIHRFSNIPVVFLACLSQKPLLAQTKSASPYGYLIKPVTEQELAVTIGNALRQIAFKQQIKQAREALALSEVRYRNLFDDSPLGFFRSTLEGRTLSVNMEMARMLGCATPDEAVGFFTDLARQFYIEPARRTQFVEGLLAKGNVRNFDCQARKINGDPVWISLNARLAPADETNRLGADMVIDGFAMDVTERKLAEDALQESEHRHRKYLAGTPYGVFAANLHGCYVQVNPSICRITGYAEHELLTMSIKDLHFEEDHTEIEQNFQTVLRQGRFQGELPFRTKSGERRWLSLTAICMDNCRVLGFCNDITERKQAEEALRESEANFRNFFDSITDMVLVANLDGSIVTANEMFCRNMAYSIPELTALNISDLYPPDKQHEVEKTLHGINRMVSHDCRLSLLASTGESIPVIMRVWSGLWNGIECIYAICRDLTNEEELQQRFERLFRYNPALMALSDVESRRIIDINDAWGQTTGYTRDEVIGRTSGELGLFPNLQQQMTSLEQLQQQGRIQDVELQIRCKDGSMRYGLFSGEMIRSQGRFFFLTVMIDITERKQAEDLLRATLERVQVILSSLHPGILLVSNEGRVEFVNSSFCKLFELDEKQDALIGLTSGELIEKAASVFIDPQRTISRIQTIITNYQAVKNEQMAITRDRTYLFDFIPIKIKDNMFGRLWHYTDISERKTADSALRASQERLQSIFRVAPTGIGSVRDRVILEVNQRVCEMTGYATEELIGRNARFLYPSREDYEYVGVEKYRQIKSKGIGVVETRWRHKDGKIIDILMASTPVDPGDSLKGTIFTALDITEQKRVAEEKRKLQTQLVQSQKLEAIGTLAGGIAHDFNNILGAVIGYAEIARDSVDSGTDLAQDLEQILKAGKRASELVKQILAFSRQAKTEPVDLYPSSIVTEVIKMLRPSLPATIAIKQCIDFQAGPVHIDPTQLHQILMNLCTNAYHAMEEAGGTLTITLTSQKIETDTSGSRSPMPPGRYAHLAVTDTGRGIAPEIQKRIFDPFFTTKETGKGTGMGLSILHGIVSGSNGYINLDSIPGNGSTFHVFLPIVVPKPLTESVPAAPATEGSEHILLVDDEEILTTMTKTMLERMGYQVTVRTSSFEALATFHNRPNEFNLVITDQTMPGMTGMDLARRMLQIRPGIPIILCTGFSPLISEEKAKASGIRGFMFKPVTRQELALQIRKVFP